MKDLTDRFGGEAQAPQKDIGADPLARLQAPEPSSGNEPATVSTWFAGLRRRADLLTAACVVLAAAIVVWPRLFPQAAHIPAVAEAAGEVATLTVQPLLTDGAWATPDWYGLFDVYQLESRLRDISIRCNYGLQPDARVEHYLHARLDPGSRIEIYLADPGRCPRS